MRRLAAMATHGAPVARRSARLRAQRLIGVLLQGVRVFMAAASTALAPITSRLRR